MQAAATTSRILTGISSIAGFTDWECLVTNDDVLRHIGARHIILLGSSQQRLLKLTDALIQIAEQAYLRRDIEALDQVSRALTNLPADSARQIGLYYQALAINRKGQREDAERLLNIVADDAPFIYRARAIQTLGTNLHDKGELDQALMFQMEALRMASDKEANGFRTSLNAHFEIAIVTSLVGNHYGALSKFESLWPVVNYFARQSPFYFYLYQNAIAVELGEIGRIQEARAACNLALASPFAPAYPEWTETRRELDARHRSANPSFIAVLLACQPKAATKPDIQPRNQLSHVRSSDRVGADSDSCQRSTPEFPAKTLTVLNAVSTIDRVLDCIAARAPPISRITLTN